MELKQVFKGTPLALIIVGITMFAMNQPGQQSKIKILTRDEDVVEVPKDLAFQSSVIKNIVEDTGVDLDTPIPLPNVTAQEFNLIINILQAIKNASDQVKFKREDGKYIAQRIQPLIDTELRSTDNLPIIAQLIYAAQYLDLEQIANGAIRVLVRKALDVFPMATIASIKSIWTSNNIMWPDSLNPVLEYQYQLVKNGNIPELSVADYIAINGMPTTSQGILELDNKGLTSLEGLNLIPHITNITRLILNDNQLFDLPARIFHGLTNLHYLQLRHNNLTQLKETLFNTLIKLNNLYLSRNRLTQLPKNIFTGLINLQILNLSANKLTQLPETIFNGLTALILIYLDNNKLTQLPDNLFNGLDPVEIRLEDNQLSTLPSTLLKGLTSLKAIFIENNLIEQDALPTTLFNDLNLIKLSILKQKNGILDFKQFVNRYFSNHTFPPGYPVEYLGDILLRDH